MCLACMGYCSNSQQSDSSFFSNSLNLLEQKAYDWDTIELQGDVGPFLLYSIYHRLISKQWITNSRRITVFLQRKYHIYFFLPLLFTKHKIMISSSHKLFILLTCIGILAVQPYLVSGFRNGIELPMNHRMLKAVSKKDLQAKPSPASSNTEFDPYQSSKRTVRRGSDPIHNRS